MTNKNNSKMVTITDIHGVDHELKCNPRGFVTEGEYSGMCVCEVEATLNRK